MPNPLPVIESCDGCGACCLVVTSPPFRRVFDESGEEGWERLRWERPDLRETILADDRARRAGGGPFFGTPCLWYDLDSRRCRHHDLRPRACREFEVGGGDCRDARRRAGVGWNGGGIPVGARTGGAPQDMMSNSNLPTPTREEPS